MLLGYGWAFVYSILVAAGIVCRYQRIRPRRLCRPNAAATLFQLRHTDADDGCSGSSDGTVLPGGVDRASSRVAHRARENVPIRRPRMSPENLARPRKGLRSFNYRRNKIGDDSEDKLVEALLRSALSL